MDYKITVTSENGNSKTFERNGIENTLRAVRVWMWAHLHDEPAPKCQCDAGHDPDRPERGGVMKDITAIICDKCRYGSSGGQTLVCQYYGQEETDPYGNCEVFEAEDPAPKCKCDAPHADWVPCPDVEEK